MKPTDTVSKGTSHRQENALRERWGRKKLNIRLTFEVLVRVKEQDSEVNVVHMCLMEGCDSTLGTRFTKPL